MKRPRDANQLGKLIVHLSTGQATDETPEPKGSRKRQPLREIAEKLRTAGSFVDRHRHLEANPWGSSGMRVEGRHMRTGG